MRHCKNCGHELKEGAIFCPECGGPIQKETVAEERQEKSAGMKQKQNIDQPNQQGSQRTQKPKKPLFPSKKSKIITLIAVIVGILLIGSYYTIDKMMMNPEAVSERFIRAIKENDVAKVKQFINAGQLEMDATKADAETFTALLNDNPRMITEIADQLALDTQKYNANGNYAIGKTEVEETPFASLKKQGKKWLVFDNYVVQIQPVYFDIESTEDDTTIFVGDKEAGSVGSEKGKTFGPYLPGNYELKAVVEGEYGKVETVQSIDFSEMSETGTKIYFNFSDYYVHLYTDNDDAIVYVNEKSTKKPIGKVSPIGPIPLDGSIKVYAQKEFSSGVKKSEVVKIDEDTSEVDLYLDYTDYDEEYEIASAQEAEQAEMEEDADEVMEIIYDHYSRISNDDFQSAYNLFSQAMKSKFSVDGWAKGLAPNLRDDVTTVEVESIDGESAHVYFEMTSYDEGEDDSVLVKEWEGYLDLVKEDGQWRLDSTDLDAVDSWIE